MAQAASEPRMEFGDLINSNQISNSASNTSVRDVHLNMRQKTFKELSNKKLKKSPIVMKDRFNAAVLERRDSLGSA